MLNQNIIYSERRESEWKNGFPIGNGRIAGMIYGELDGRIALNHELLYRGINTDREVEPVPPEKLAELRELLLSGKYHEGTRLGNELIAGKGGISGQPGRVDPYQPAGDIIIEGADAPENVSAYFRALELDKALYRSEYVCGKRRVSRRCFASAEKENGCICYEFVSNEPSKLRVRFERPEDPGCRLEMLPEQSGFTVYGEFEGDSHFAVTLSVRECDGELRFEDGALMISDAKRAVIYINLGAGAKNEDVRAEAGRTAECGFGEALERHTALWRERFNDCRITLDCCAPELPIEKRLERLRAGEEDAALPLLWYNYAKYLLLSSCGKLPPNLQGKWNSEIAPPWQCDYHLDVNLQMCYWFAEAAGLSCCTDSLFAFCEKFVPNAREAAQRLYGCGGIVFPLQTDAHGRATPESCGWAVWIGAAAWLGMHFWERWEYSRDKKFLAQHAYPFLKAVAEFYKDYLVEADGALQLVPSQSPENKFGGEEFPVSLCVSSAMDVQLCGMTLSHASEAAAILGCDLEERLLWDELRRKLPALGIGSRGQLLEWNGEFPEDEPGHRHYSHLIGLYPGDIINRRHTPELFEAAEISLRERLSHGGGHTGWSRSWTACLLARLGDAEGAWTHMSVLIADFATDSLLDLHPPRIFQIDGNFGGAAAVNEMLLRSTRDGLSLLPALPKAWKKGGSVSGMRAKNGLTLSFEWRDGALLWLEVKAEVTGRCMFEYPGADLMRVEPERGAASCISCADGVFVFSVIAGESYRLTPKTSREETVVSEKQ